MIFSYLVIVFSQLITDFLFFNVQDNKADVILKYTPDEARNLKTYGELPDNGKFRS